MIILILMAGMGTRTKEIDPITPKPLLKIHGIPMINWVVSNFILNSSSKFIFVVQKIINQKFGLHDYFSQLNIEFEIVELDGPNEGAAISALAGSKHYIDQELLIVNSDQFLTLDMNLFVSKARDTNCDGMILTMNAIGPKWSYIRLNSQQEVVEVAEKKEISQIATVGAYWFKNGSHFIQGVLNMIRQDDRTRNEFYLAPVYNYLIKDSKNILNFHIEDHQSKFFGLGTSEDILNFVENPISTEFAKSIKGFK